MQKPRAPPPPSPSTPAPPVRRGQPALILLAPPQLSRKLPRTPLTLTSHLSRPDLHRSYLAAVLPSAGKLLLPLSSCLRPSSAQFDHSISFLLPCCSSPAQAWSSSSSGIPSPTSTLPPPSRPPWRRTFRLSLSFPKTSDRCALTSWCSLTTSPPTPRRSLTEIWPAFPLPFFPDEPRV
jgi:hypothetical protein